MPTAQAVFVMAVELTDPAARASFLAEACGGDSKLKDRVEALLRAHDQPDSLLDAPLVAPAETGATRSFAADAESTGTRHGGEGAPDEEIPFGFLAPPARPDSLGRIGHYEVLQVLGRGGFGIVFRAFDDVLHRVVAVKVLSPQMAATSPARKRFLREARSSAQVRHENVVQVYEVGETPLPFIVMEFIPGETLQQRLDRTGPVDVPEVLRVGRQIAEGLAAAHATDLIHRDIKPGNVLLEGGAQRVKITDFGLARAADDASISQSGVIAGTPMFMAPEQAKGEKLDHRADLFSLGSVMYQMAAGRAPFRANGTLAVLKRVAEDTPRDIREVIPETPQWLCDIIARLHAKNPADRFQTARGVADVLADCEAQLKTKEKLKDFGRIPRGKRPSTGGPGRRKWAAAAAVLLPVVALAVVATVGALLPFQRRPATDGPGPHGGDPTPGPVAKQGPPPLAVAPFDAARAKKHQEDWAKYLGVPVEYTNGIGMKFYLIPPGEFTMGCSREEIEEFGTNGIYLTAQRKVIIPAALYLAECEVTIGQFRAFVKETGYRTVAETAGGGHGQSGQKPECVWTLPAAAPSDQHPVVFVTLTDARTFCDWLGRKDSRAYSVPSEEEWEYACRAGTTTRWWTGDDPAEMKKQEELTTISPVGRLGANPFGLRDLHGNVSEVCRGPGDTMVMRGGAAVLSLSISRSAFRHPHQVDVAWLGRGFRVAVVGDLRPATSPAPPVPGVNQVPVPPTYKNGIGMEFVCVPTGKSWLGGGKDKLGDKEVVIPADFYLGKYEVTQEEWEKVMGENPSHFSRTGQGADALKGIEDADLKRFPVENVSWDQIQVFAAKLNQREKEAGWVYRLPTEAEWEYACRGGPTADKADSGSDFYFARPTNTLLPGQANFDKGLGRSCKVGLFEANRLGLFDMHGNVWEWCEDAEQGADGVSHRAHRGGGWGSDSGDCRAAHRNAFAPSVSDRHLGLRLARVPVRAPSPDAKTPPAGPDRRAGE